MEYGIKASDRRVLRICRILGIKSVIKSNPGGKYGSKAKAQHICENLLNREFHTDSPLTKTATDVTELKVPVRMPGATEQKVYKVYLSAILDLCGYNIVSFEMSNHNDTPLAVATLDEAMRLNPGAKFLIHTDRGSPYTSREYEARIKYYGLTQSMSRPGKCLDNAAMEGFWGMLKREIYYGHYYASVEELKEAITKYIHRYNEERIQRKFKILAPAQYARLRKDIGWLMTLP